MKLRHRLSISSSPRMTLLRFPTQLSLAPYYQPLGVVCVPTSLALHTIYEAHCAPEGRWSQRPKIAARDPVRHLSLTSTARRLNEQSHSLRGKLPGASVEGCLALYLLADARECKADTDNNNPLLAQLEDLYPNIVANYHMSFLEEMDEQGEFPKYVIL